MIAMFSRYREYIMVKISMHITPYLIESTLELLERTGVDFMHTMIMCVHKFTLLCFANCSNGMADSVL